MSSTALSQLPRWTGPNEAGPAELAVECDVQVGGKNGWSAGSAATRGDQLILKSSDAELVIALVDCTLGNVKTQRSGHPHTVRISLREKDENGNYKHVLSLADEATHQMFTLGLQEKITACLDAEEQEEVAVDTPVDSMPNMVFIPLKTVDPAVPPKEFAMFLVLLGVFMFTLQSQNLTDDFATNDALRGMTNMVQFGKISTIEDYLAWFPVILDGLRRWSSSRTGWTLPSADEASNDDTAAVLVGLPLLLQVRKRTQTIYGQIVDPLPLFNASGEHECPWQLLNASEWQALSHTDPTSGLPAGSSGCYGAALTQHSRINLYRQDEYFIPDMQGILNGTYQWSPASWISTDTLELSHRFTLFFQNDRRFAVVNIAVSIDAAGSVVQRSISGSAPSFETFSPFMLEDDHAVHTLLELALYLFFFKLLVDEMFEIWECICMTELLLPIQVLNASLELQLKQIEYFHERASEVYDPRDPKTEEAFDFPDISDLHAHNIGSVKDCQTAIDTLEEELVQVKLKMGANQGKKLKRKQYNVLRNEMQTLQESLREATSKQMEEAKISQTAATLQLACMWDNDWSFDFPPNYLADISGDATVGEDGVEAFKHVDWIAVAREYVGWCRDTGHDMHIVQDGVTVGMLRQRFKAMALGVLQSKKRKNLTQQHKAFEHLSSLLDYLDMLVDVLHLHKQIASARLLKYWNGPKGVELGGTVSRAFQKQIRRYNHIGKALKEQMLIFPAEIAEGFTEPDMMKAKLCKIKAKALQNEMMASVEACGMLGLFFAGSPLWEVQRKKRLTSKFNKTEALRASLSIGGMGVVNDSAMKLYVRASEIEEDPDAEEPANPGGTLKAGGEDDTTTKFSNPIAQSLFDGEDASGPEAVSVTKPASENGETSEDEDDLMMHSPTRDERRTGFAIAREQGTSGWRKWIPESAEHLINHDGQFVASPSSVKRMMTMANVPALVTWFSRGIRTYMADTWNPVEFMSCILFMIQLVAKVQMLLMADDLENERLAIARGNGAESLSLVAAYSEINHGYNIAMRINAVIMWCKLFKYLGVIPQMGVLLEVLGKAGPSVLIFSMVAMVPCMGLSLSYHVAFGHSIKSYSTIGMSVNTLMKMSVGDFDFDEIYQSDSSTALVLFWGSSLLVVFVLINIFVAIIMSAYDTVLKMNPDAADASSFLYMVLMQVSRVVAAAFGVADSEDAGDEIHPHVLQNKMQRIDDEDYWGIFDGYFHADDFSLESIKKGDRVRVTKQGSHKDETAVVIDPNWNDRVKVKRDLDGKVASYLKSELEQLTTDAQRFGLVSFDDAATAGSAAAPDPTAMVRSTDRRGQGKEEKSAAADVKKLLAAFSAIQTSQESFQKEQRKKLDEMAQTQAKLLKLLEQQAKQGA